MHDKENMKTLKIKRVLQMQLRNQFKAQQNFSLYVSEICSFKEQSYRVVQTIKI